MTRRGPNQDSLSRSVRELDASLGQVKSITPAVYARVAALWREVLPARSPALPPSLCLPLPPPLSPSPPLSLSLTPPPPPPRYLSLAFSLARLFFVSPIAPAPITSLHVSLADKTFVIQEASGALKTEKLQEPRCAQEQAWLRRLVRPLSMAGSQEPFTAAKTRLACPLAKIRLARPVGATRGQSRRRSLLARVVAAGWAAEAPYILSLRLAHGPGWARVTEEVPPAGGGGGGAGGGLSPWRASRRNRAARRTPARCRRLIWGLWWTGCRGAQT